MSLTPEKIIGTFNVDAEAGRLYWRVAPRNRSDLLGREAGCAHEGGGKTYWLITIGGRAVKRALLVYTVANGGPPPAGQIVDHANGDSLDDRPENLRAATPTQNAWNHKGRARRISLPMGVRHMNGRFQARINHHRVQYHLGAYDTPEEASAVYRAKRRELFGEFA